MNGKSVVRPCIFGGLWAAWCGFIFFNSFQTGTTSSGLSDKIAGVLFDLFKSLGAKPNMDTIIVFIRKGAHMGEFFIMGILLCLCFYYGANRYLSQSGVILFLLLAVGVMDEFIQSFIAGRSSQVSDVLIDFGGAVIAFAVIALISLKAAGKRRYSRRISRG